MREREFDNLLPVEVRERPGDDDNSLSLGLRHRGKGAFQIVCGSDIDGQELDS